MLNGGTNSAVYERAQWIESASNDLRELEAEFGDESDPVHEATIERAREEADYALFATIPALNDPDEAIRDEALSAIEQAGLQGLACMCQAMRRTRSTALRLNILRGLGMIGKDEPILVLRLIGEILIEHGDADHLSAFVDAGRSLMGKNPNGWGKKATPISST